MFHLFQVLHALLLFLTFLCWCISPEMGQYTSVFFLNSNKILSTFHNYEVCYALKKKKNDPPYCTRNSPLVLTSSSFYHDEEFYQIIFLHWDKDIIFLLCRWLRLTDFIELNQPFIPVINQVWSWLIIITCYWNLVMGFPGGTVVKNLLANAGDAGYMGLILGREDPLE